jgi:ureidoglycolate lyase
MAKESAGALIKTVPINRAAYAPYGNIIGAADDLPFNWANMKTAKRFNFVADIVNSRANAKLNLCVFRCSPLEKWPMEVKLLEKHHYSTQVFMPMESRARYLAIVCLGGDAPDLSTLMAFSVEGAQGVSYKPGIWHYPMTAVSDVIDFACLVYEDGGKDDCEIYNLQQPLTVQLTD